MKNELNKLIKQLEKDYNVKLASEIEKPEIVKTGIYVLDYVLDGGIVLGEGGHRIEFFGAESSGKTTFALHIIKKFQELDKKCVFMDAEDSYDSDWADITGIDNNKLLVIKPRSLEELGDLMVKLIPNVDLVVVDSIVSLIPEEEINRDTNEPTMGLQARVNALITRKIYQSIADKKTVLIFINQLREKIGIMYGNPYTTGGGRAIKHLYNTRVEFKSGKYIDVGSGDKKERVGVEITLHCVKNKKGVPHKKGVVDFYFNGYIDNKKSLLFTALKLGLIERNGGYYTYKDMKIQGKEKLIETLTEEDWKEIETEIWKRKK